MKRATSFANAPVSSLASPIVMERSWNAHNARAATSANVAFTGMRPTRLVDGDSTRGGPSRSSMRVEKLGHRAADRVDTDRRHAQVLRALGNAAPAAPHPRALPFQQHGLIAARKRIDRHGAA